MTKAEINSAESFLRAREIFCVAAISRFLRHDTSGIDVWQLPDESGEISSLLLHNRKRLFPMFGKNASVPAPRFLSRFFTKVPIHAIQGLQSDAELLEALMRDMGYFSAECLDYDLMALDSPPRPRSLKVGPAGLVLRPPLPQDEEALFVLQCAYEQEEVLSAKSVFDPAVVRLNLAKILSKERLLLAELGGQVVGKINSNAHSFTRTQIGGIYVRPDCRSLGIATKMTAVFSQAILEEGRGVSLFVKKSNAAACKAYRNIGFAVVADYRITYY